MSRSKRPKSKLTETDLCALAFAFSWESTEWKMSEALRFGRAGTFFLDAYMLATSQASHLRQFSRSLAQASQFALELEAQSRLKADADFLATKIETLGFSTRTMNSLRRRDVETLNDLLDWEKVQKRWLPGFGVGCASEVAAKLLSLGFPVTAMFIRGQFKPQKDFGISLYRR